MKSKEVKIIRSMFPASLEDKVNTAIDNGFTEVGNLIIGNDSALTVIVSKPILEYSIPK